MGMGMGKRIVIMERGLSEDMSAGIWRATARMSR